MTVTPVKNMLFVEIYDKRNKRRSEGSDPFVSVVASANFGVVKYSGDESFPVGTQVYYGNQFEKIIVEGTEVMAMNSENVFAVAV